MKLRTKEMLSDYLSSDLGWRKKELSDIRRLAQLNKSTLRQRVLIRSGIALLYAHFEGFTRQAGKAYLEYVASQRLTYNLLERNFLALGLMDVLSSVTSSRKASSFECGVQFLLESGPERARIPYKTAIDTESNLSSKVLKEIIFVLGLDYSPYESKAKLIDSRLLGRRNSIAHGEIVSIDDEDYDQLHNSVIEIINCLRNQIENAAVQETFRRTTQPPAQAAV